MPILNIPTAQDGKLSLAVQAALSVELSSNFISNKKVYLPVVTGTCPNLVYVKKTYTNAGT